MQEDRYEMNASITMKQNYEPPHMDPQFITDEAI